MAAAKFCAEIEIAVYISENIGEIYIPASLKKTEGRIAVIYEVTKCEDFPRPPEYTFMILILPAPVQVFVLC